MSQLRDALRRAGSCAAALALIGSTAVILAPSVAADTNTRYVATDGDNNVGGSPNDCKSEASPCSTIQYAVNQANGGDTISVGAGTYAESVHIRESLTIVGAGTSGADDTIVSGGPGGSASSVFVDGVDTDAPVVVTVTDLDVSGNSDLDGIMVEDATLHLSDSVVSNNWDGVDVRGASTATVNGSTLESNGHQGVNLDQTEDSESPPSVGVNDSVVSGNGDGGVVIEAGSAFIENTTLDKNVGAGVVADGNGTDATINTSTISGTAPLADVEGVPYGGGVLVFPGGTADISTSTIVGNTGQGVYSFHGTVTIADSTIAGTRSEPSDALPSGGVVYDSAVPELRTAARARAEVLQPEGPGVSVIGTIIASQADGVPDCSGGITDGGYNLSSDAANSCEFSAVDHDLIKTNPKLGALQDNGGPTLTMKPAGDSPAIDAIPPTDGTTCNGDYPTDQRGTARPIGSGCDIGAVEAPAAAQPPPPRPPARRWSSTRPRCRTALSAPRTRCS